VRIWRPYVRYRWIVAVAPLVLLACATAPSGERKIDVAVRQFNEIAFGVAPAHELRFDDSTRSAWVSKWDRPVLASVFGAAADAPVADARMTLSEIASITGHQVVWHRDGSADANLLIHFTGERDFVINANEIAGCYTEIHDAVGRISRVEVFIGIEADGSISDCMTHELMHAFGFHGHALRPTSVLSGFAPTDDLTPSDRLALRTLYDPQLVPGMPRDRALPMARGIMERLLAQP